MTSMVAKFPFVLVLGVVIFPTSRADGELAAGAHQDAPEAALDLQQKYGHWACYVANGQRTALSRCWGQQDAPIDPQRCALIVVHMQKETMERNTFMDAVGLYNPALRDQYFQRIDGTVLPNLDKLVRFFRANKMPIIYTSLGNEGPHPRFSPRLEANEHVITNTTANVFHETQLEPLLKERKIDTLFIAGVGTSHCVTFSTYGAMSRGYQVIVIPDATADPRPDHHEAILKIIGLHGFLRSTSDVISDYPWQSWIEAKPIPQTASR